VNYHQIDIIQLHLFEGMIDGYHRLVVSFDPRLQFGGSEHLATLDTTATDTLSHALLVAIGLGGVVMAATCSDRVLHRLSGMRIFR
jgi:hypothetical protein